VFTLKKKIPKKGQKVELCCLSKEKRGAGHLLVPSFDRFQVFYFFVSVISCVVLLTVCSI